MKLTNLSENILLIEQHRSVSNRILRESLEGLTFEQRTIVEGIHRELQPLIEASLDPNQIKQIFKDLEQQSIAAGGSRNLMGKGVDVAKQANEVINKVGRWLQDTAPVKAFDQKFEDLKNKINTKFPDSKLLDKISDLGIWAKENPGKTAAIIGVLTAIAALASGPVGGAIAGQILKGSVELLKGEKLSTAIGKGAKAAALGWLTGKAIEFIGNALTDPMVSQANEMGKEIVSANYKATIDEIGGKFGSRFGNFETGQLYGKASDIADIRDVWKDGVESWKAGEYLRANNMFKAAEEMTAKLSDPAYVQSVADTVEKAKTMAANAKEMQKFFGTMSDVAQGAATGASDSGKKESYYLQSRPLSEGQIYIVFDRVLAEAGFLDKAKELGGKAVGAVAKGAAWTGKQATEKVTSAKLTAAWKMAGSPTDSEELKKFLLDYDGMSPEIVDKVYADMKISSEPQQGAEEPQSADQPATVQAGTLYSQVKKNVLTLNNKDKRRMMAYLQKQLGTA